MRTTVTLDSDVEQIVRERMDAHGVSFKQALNDAIRDGVRGSADNTFVTRTFNLGLRVDLTHANRVVAELDNQVFLDKVRAGR